MDFSIPSAIQAVLAQIREFMEDEVYPLEQECFRQGGLVESLPAVQAARETVKRLGLWAPQMPRAWGGLGLTVLQHALVSEELGRSPLGHYLFNCQAPDAGNMEILMECGTEAQRERYLRPLAAGQIRSCFAMTEPEFPGSNPVWMGTTAVKDSDGWAITGHKWFASAADGAAFAIVMAVTDADAPAHGRASMFIVPTDTPGYTLVRNIPVMGQTGRGCFGHGEIRFEACRVPRENLLGEEGKGFRVAQARLGPGRIHHCMRWVGVCERAFELMCTRAAARALAPGEALAGQQLVQAWIAESRARINAARLMVLHAAWKIDTLGAREAREEISLIKFFVADVLTQVLDRAIQVHGALGMTEDLPLSHFYRHERGAHIYDGPDEVHKMVVAKQILRGFPRP